ncbi:uncharacterized protein F4822DRAFT_405743 [Hypoxylon trugodes]|uniref:uncharacterized protein n=1 Tax=Hypoxylon trugodes TaxID=326681 RepID=UPI00219E47DF|nr:uncharacterized protein F4822DRAFT_405743 [Hypoxylon trugodes]KAI1387209.1 hypothetical protein F4822DRAFT_405743 [Hypoxylon trugodes]
MFDEDIELIRPVPFQYSDDDARNIPDLDEDEFDDLTAVLKALARGSYPRLEAVPFALNAYNCDQMMINDDDERKPWAYFHPVTIVDVRMIDTKVRPRIDLDGVILEDLERDWQPIRAIDHTGSGKGGGRVGSIGQDSARYRFLCFIHKHRIDRKRSSQKAVHTISIWDREVCHIFVSCPYGEYTLRLTCVCNQWDELTWHDTYHVNRESRRRDIQHFWRRVKAKTWLGGDDLRDEFIDRIRYRTVYHICERLEDTMRDTVPPRNTLWSVSEYFHIPTTLFTVAKSFHSGHSALPHEQRARSTGQHRA